MAGWRQKRSHTHIYTQSSKNTRVKIPHEKHSFMCIRDLLPVTSIGLVDSHTAPGPSLPYLIVLGFDNNSIQYKNTTRRLLETVTGQDELIQLPHEVGNFCTKIISYQLLVLN